VKTHLIHFLALLGFSITSVSAQEGTDRGGADKKAAGTEAKPATKFKPSSNYRLKGGDEVQLIVYEEEELNKTTALTPTGEASFLLIESINLNGLTLAEAAAKIENAFKPDYLKKTQSHS
jgi:protein involved in polysaccharide export with SLBB domain